jgi:hypothetical protein
MGPSCCRDRLLHIVRLHICMVTPASDECATNRQVRARRAFCCLKMLLSSCLTPCTDCAVRLMCLIAVFVSSHTFPGVLQCAMAVAACNPQKGADALLLLGQKRPAPLKIPQASFDDDEECCAVMPQSGVLQSLTPVARPLFHCSRMAEEQQEEDSSRCCVHQWLGVMEVSRRKSCCSLSSYSSADLRSSCSSASLSTLDTPHTEKPSLAGHVLACPRRLLLCWAS